MGEFLVEVKLGLHRGKSAQEAAQAALNVLKVGLAQGDAVDLVAYESEYDQKGSQLRLR